MIAPIFSEEGEAWILSGLLSGGQSHNDEVIHKLEESHFYGRNNQIVFKSIVEAYGRGNPLNASTICQSLKDSGKIEEVGGEYFIHKLSSSAPTSAHADYWIGVLEEKRLMREAIELLSDSEREIRETQDVSSFISELESKVLRLRKIKESGNLLESSSDLALLRNEKLLKGIKTLGISTGIKPLDSTLGGFGESQLIYICARAGKGKTSLLEQIFGNVIDQEKPILIFQRDMPVEMMLERMACRNALVNYFTYRVGYCSREQNLLVRHELEKLKRLKDKLHIQSPFRLTAQDLLSIVRREKKKHGIECVFLDHIQNLDIPEENFREGLTRASTLIRRSAQDSRLPHVIIAQLNREGHEGRPKASHVKEFDAAYADCDSMVMLWSEKSQADLSPGEMLPIKFTFVKNRYGPETEDEMLFDGSFLKFKERK